MYNENGPLVVFLVCFWGRSSILSADWTDKDPLPHLLINPSRLFFWQAVVSKETTGSVWRFPKELGVVFVLGFGGQTLEKCGLTSQKSQVSKPSKSLVPKYESVGRRIQPLIIGYYHRKLVVTPIQKFSWS